MTRDLMLVSISLFAWGIGEGMFIYFQPIYLQELGASPLLIGTILGVMGIAMAVTQIPAGYIGDKFGRRPLMWFSWGLGTLSASIMAFSSGLNGFVVGLILYGATSFVMAPMNSYISNARGKWSIGRALTTASAAYNLGAVIGPVIGGTLADELGLKRIYAFAAGLFLVSTIIILFVSKQPVDGHKKDIPRFGLVQNHRFVTLMGILFLTMLTTYLPQPLTSNFLKDYRHLDISQIGTLGSIGSLGNALLAITLGRINARVGFLAGQVAVLLASIVIWKGTGLPWYMLGYFFLGGIRICKSLSMALTRPLIQASQMGVAYGFLETVGAIAIIVAPPLAGLLYQHDPQLIYMVSAVSIAIVFLLSLKFLPGDHQPQEELLVTPERE
ncbi:MAG: hypothetical protein C0391_05035 [Anaerolinea sp.]|nr:hypothetical protein [Anaerolinea sp.]